MSHRKLTNTIEAISIEAVLAVASVRTWQINTACFLWTLGIPLCTFINICIKKRKRKNINHITSSMWIKPSCVTIQMKATEKYFHVVSTIYYAVCWWRNPKASAVWTCNETFMWYYYTVQFNLHVGGRTFGNVLKNLRSLRCYSTEMLLSKRTPLWGGHGWLAVPAEFHLFVCN